MIFGTNKNRLKSIVKRGTTDMIKIVIQIVYNLRLLSIYLGTTRHHK